MSEAIELTRALVALDTVNPALVPGAPGERPAVELLAARLGSRGFQSEIVGPPDRPSLVTTHRGRGGGPSLALNGHLDTVGVEGMDDPFSAAAAGGGWRQSSRPRRVWIPARPRDPRLTRPKYGPPR